MRKGDFEKQNGGGDIERALGGEKVAACTDFLEQARERLRQRFAAWRERMQRLFQRLGEIDQASHARGIEVRLRVAGQSAPGVAQGLHALADLLHQGGVDQAEMALVVIGKRRGSEVQPVVNGSQHRKGLRGDVAIAVQRLGAKEGEVVTQPLGGGALSLQLATQLQVEAVEQPLNVEIGREQAAADGFEQAAREPPQAGRRPRAAGLRPTRDGVERLHGGGGLLAAQHMQQTHFKLGAIIRRQGGGRSACGVGDGRGVRPGPVVVPQVGRVDALGLRQFHQVAVLWIKLERRFIFARPLGFEKIDQGVEASLETLQCGVVEFFRMVDELIERVLGGLHQARRAKKTQQFDGACGLVHLGAGGAQARHFGLDRTEHAVVLLLGGALERGAGGLEVVADLIEQPGQRPHVRLRGRCHGGVRSGDCVHAGKREGRTLECKRGRRVS